MSPHPPAANVPIHGSANSVIALTDSQAALEEAWILSIRVLIVTLLTNNSLRSISLISRAFATDLDAKKSFFWGGKWISIKTRFLVLLLVTEICQVPVFVFGTLKMILN